MSWYLRNRNIFHLFLVWGLPGFVMSWYQRWLIEMQEQLGLGIARICNVMVHPTVSLVTCFICLGIARICNVMVPTLPQVSLLPNCLGIARICNVMVLFAVRRPTTLNVWGLPGFVMSWYELSCKRAIAAASGDCPDL